ncbi:hypothetical protein A9Q81_23190 [Gammaproteobacteria bacterium 42_54_T18]|mgnify:CR=1 FL=1|nr:hypothetical protein A9Q81_23190 [Gammaproteobacteria bacterium 42_54_T18]
MQTALTTDCWVLNLNGGYTLAISIYQVAELVNNAPRLPIPQAPAHCCYLISWRDKLIPLVDYQACSSSLPSSLTSDTDNIMIVKFREEDESIQYLAFAVTSVEKYTVNDEEFSTPKNQNNIPFSSSIISAFHSTGRSNDSSNNNSSSNTTYIIDMKHLHSS